jgi:ATP-binding cassette, subfamily G (WHITE), member 2, PDR
MALTIASIFFGTQNDTNNFFAKGGILFFAILLDALAA